MAENPRRDVLTRAIVMCIAPDDDALATIGDVFTEAVTVWSPNMLATSLAELTDALADREDAFSDVAIEIDAIDLVGEKGFVEFRVLASFTGPFVIGDDVIIEPNGERILLGAAAVAEFDGDRIKALRGYFDDASLLEQMIPA